MNAILRFFLHPEQWNTRAAGLFLVAMIKNVRIYEYSVAGARLTPKIRSI